MFPISLGIIVPFGHHAAVRLSAKIVGDHGVHARLVPFANFGRERRKSPRLDGHRPQQRHELGAAGTVGKPLRNDGQGSFWIDFVELARRNDGYRIPFNESCDYGGEEIRFILEPVINRTSRYSCFPGNLTDAHCIVSISYKGANGGGNDRLETHCLSPPTGTAG